MNRRRFLVSAVSSSVALAGGGALASPAGAATDDDLVFANFGAATELLLKDFYGKVREAKLFKGQLDKAFARGRFAADQHVTELTAVLTDSGQAPPIEEDLEVAWPANTFTSKKRAASAGTTIVEALLGVYLTGAATSPTLSMRVLYSSLAASLGEQLSALSFARGRPAIGNSFPAALDVDTAGAAVERFFA